MNVTTSEGITELTASGRCMIDNLIQWYSVHGIISRLIVRGSVAIASSVYFFLVLPFQLRMEIAFIIQLIEMTDDWMRNCRMHYWKQIVKILYRYLPLFYTLITRLWKFFSPIHAISRFQFAYLITFLLKYYICKTITYLKN